jgi:sporulation protein YlmC with PRC-barrel domain
VRRLEVGEDVIGADGVRLGMLERIVVDEHAKRVSHLVVDGHAVPVESFRDAGPDGLATDLAAGDLERHPTADEPPFAAPGEHWRAPDGYRLESFLRVAGALFGQAPFTLPVHSDMETAGISEISAGSPVWAGGRRIGTVTEVFTDDAGTISALAIDRSRLAGGEVLLPVRHVREVVGNNVHAALSEEELDGLEPYQPGQRRTP